MEAEKTLTFQAFQEHIRNKYYETDSERGTPATFMWLMEEVGELATALHNIAKEPENEAYQFNLREEFADVIAWLSTLANINGVDLQAAIEEKYLNGDGPAGTK